MDLKIVKNKLPKKPLPEMNVKTIQITQLSQKECLVYTFEFSFLNVNYVIIKIIEQQYVKENKCTLWLS